MEIDVSTLTPGSHDFRITATGRDGTTRVYIITISRDGPGEFLTAVLLQCILCQWWVITDALFKHATTSCAVPVLGLARWGCGDR